MASIAYGRCMVAIRFFDSGLPAAVTSIHIACRSHHGGFPFEASIWVRSSLLFRVENRAILIFSGRILYWPSMPHNLVPLCSLGGSSQWISYIVSGWCGWIPVGSRKKELSSEIWAFCFDLAAGNCCSAPDESQVGPTGASIHIGSRWTHLVSVFRCCQGQVTSFGSFEFDSNEKMVVTKQQSTTTRHGTYLFLWHPGFFWIPGVELVGIGIGSVLVGIGYFVFCIVLTRRDEIFVPLLVSK
jgi:hypothetical protein